LPISLVTEDRRTTYVLPVLRSSSAKHASSYYFRTDRDMATLFASRREHAAYSFDAPAVIQQPSKISLLNGPLF
jgi:hypothetical protein